MIYLVASCTDNYWERARPYLASLARHLNPEIVPIIFSVGCDAPPWVVDMGLSTRRIDRNVGETQLRAVQHGSFLPHTPTRDPQDLIICTDCDMMLQRPLNTAEMASLDALTAANYAAGMNAGPDDTLADEARRMGTPYDADELDRILRGYAAIGCINGGWIAARREAWQKLYREYLSRHDLADAVFKHKSRVQWLISYAAAAAGLTRITASPNWHCHFHYGVPDDVTRDGHTVLYRGRPVLWTHVQERFIGGEE